MFPDRGLKVILKMQNKKNRTRQVAAGHVKNARRPTPPSAARHTRCGRYLEGGAGRAGWTGNRGGGRPGPRAMSPGEQEPKASKIVKSGCGSCQDHIFEHTSLDLPGPPWTLPGPLSPSGVASAILDRPVGWCWRQWAGVRLVLLLLRSLFHFLSPHCNSSLAEEEKEDDDEKKEREEEEKED